MALSADQLQRAIAWNRRTGAAYSTIRSAPLYGVAPRFSGWADAALAQFVAQAQQELGVTVDGAPGPITLTAASRRLGGAVPARLDGPPDPALALAIYLAWDPARYGVARRTGSTVRGDGGTTGGGSIDVIGPTGPGTQIYQRPVKVRVGRHTNSYLIGAAALFGGSETKRGQEILRRLGIGRR